MFKVYRLQFPRTPFSDQNDAAMPWLAAIAAWLLLPISEGK
jgi:hypothetical protein